MAELPHHIQNRFKDSPPSNHADAVDRALPVVVEKWIWVKELVDSAEARLAAMREQRAVEEAVKNRAERAQEARQKIYAELEAWDDARIAVTDIMTSRLSPEATAESKAKYQTALDAHVAAAMRSFEFVEAPYNEFAQTWAQAVLQQISAVKSMEGISPEKVGCIVIVDASGTTAPSFGSRIGSNLQKLPEDVLVFVLSQEEMGSFEQIAGRTHESTLHGLFKPEQALWYTKPFPTMWATRGIPNSKCVMAHLARRVKTVQTSPVEGRERKRKRITHMPVESPWSRSALWETACMIDLSKPLIGYVPLPLDGSESEGEVGKAAERPAPEVTTLSVNKKPMRELGPRQRAAQHGKDFWSQLLGLATRDQEGGKLWDHLVVAVVGATTGEIPIVALSNMIFEAEAGRVISARRARISVVLADPQTRNVQLAKMTLQQGALDLVKDGVVVDGVKSPILSQSLDLVEKEARSLVCDTWEKVASSLEYFQLDAADPDGMRRFQQPAVADICIKHRLDQLLVADVFSDIPSEYFSENSTVEVAQRDAAVLPASPPISEPSVLPFGSAVGEEPRGLHAGEEPLGSQEMDDAMWTTLPSQGTEKLDSLSFSVTGNTIKSAMLRVKATAPVCFKKGEILWVSDGGIASKKPGDCCMPFRLSSTMNIAITDDESGDLRIMKVQEALQQASQRDSCDVRHALLGHTCFTVSDGKFSVRRSSDWFFQPHPEDTEQGGLWSICALKSDKRCLLDVIFVLQWQEDQHRFAPAHVALLAHKTFDMQEETPAVMLSASRA